MRLQGCVLCVQEHASNAMQEAPLKMQHQCGQSVMCILTDGLCEGTPPQPGWMQLGSRLSNDKYIKLIDTGKIMAKCAGQDATATQRPA